MPPRRASPTGRQPHAIRRVAVLLLSGLLPLGALVAGSAAAQSLATPHPSSDPYAPHITEAAQRFGIPERWIRAVMHAESRGNRRAVSPKGAMGLMQIMPATWAALTARHALGIDPYDTRANILAGAAYLRAMYDRYGSVDAMLAAYNAGPGRYEASRTGRPLPPETLAYVAAITPVLDGQVATRPIRLAANDPLAWTRASLFIARSERIHTNDSVPPERGKDGIPAAADARDPSAIMLRADGLFVTRSGGGEVR